MKLVIFAGGIGTRFWPLSRENSPKQFDKIFNNKSTLELAISRVEPIFGIENIYIQSVDKYKNLIKEQIPNLPDKNILVEPCRRDTGPAVCFAALELNKRGFEGAIAILWADHLMDKVDEFTKALQSAEKLVINNNHQIILIGEKPRFANNNLGWIKTGNKIDKINEASFYEFQGWKYKPEAGECREMFESGSYLWNPGYFVTSIKFLLGLYKNLAPEIHKCIREGKYEQVEAIHFDRAIAERMDLSKAVVLKTDMGWSDPGTLYALKEALEKNSQANVIKGRVSELNTSDCLLYNLEENKLVAAVGLKGMVIVNTPDALLVVPKEEVVNVTKLVKKIADEGLKKYL